MLCHIRHIAGAGVSMMRGCQLTPSAWRCFSQSQRVSESDEPAMVSDYAGYHKTPIVNQLWANRRAATSGEDQSQQTVSQSERSVSYPFGTDPLLRDAYMNPWGSIRMGRLFEDLDAMAGNIASFHSAGRPMGAEEKQNRLALVTAAVERAIVDTELHPRTVDSNMTMTGRVGWVGRSSMHIDIDLITEGAPRPWLSAGFIFVAQDMDTGAPARIPPVLPETPVEIATFQRLQARNEEEKRQRSALKEKQKMGGALALLSWPNDELMEEARKLVIRARLHQDIPFLSRTSNEVLMSNTRLENAMITQPQHRNTRGNVFGGFLIRRAFELAHATAYLLAGAQPYFRELDHVQFLKPVRVGVLLRLEAVVLYTSHSDIEPLIHVEVVARSIKPEVTSSTVSTVLHFTFAVAPSTTIPIVLPDSIEDARRATQQRHNNKVQCDGT